MHPGATLTLVHSNLGVTKLILSVVDVQGAQQLLCGLPAVHKRVIREGTGVQDAVPRRSGRSCHGQDRAQALDSEWEGLPESPKGRTVHKVAGGSVAVLRLWCGLCKPQHQGQGCGIRLKPQHLGSRGGEILEASLLPGLTLSRKRA